VIGDAIKHHLNSVYRDRLKFVCWFIEQWFSVKHADVARSTKAVVKDVMEVEIRGVVSVEMCLCSTFQKVKTHLLFKLSLNLSLDTAGLTVV
jgi:hypothetical protein